MTRDREAKAEEDRHIGFRWLAHEAGLHGEAEAEAVFRAVSRTLSRRIGPEETRHLASPLRLGLRDVWHEETDDVVDAARFNLDQLVADVQDELGVLTPSTPAGSCRSCSRGSGTSHRRNVVTLQRAYRETFATSGSTPRSPRSPWRIATRCTRRERTRA